jgi:hypothetical protein
MDVFAPLLRASTDESWKKFDLGDMRGREYLDSVIREISSVVEGSRVAKIPRRPQLRR